MRNSIFLFAATFLPWLAVSAPLATPYVPQEARVIRGVSLVASNTTQFQKLEAVIDLSATFDNPFDPEDIALDARVLTPSGKHVSVPGFFFQPFARELRNGREQLTPVAKPTWRVRWTPSEVGAHELQFVLRDRNGTSEFGPVRVRVEPQPSLRQRGAGDHGSTNVSDSRGFIRISPKDVRYFEFADGTPFFPIGANVCWAYGRGTFDYDQWFARYSEAGCNYGRLWLSPHWTTFAIEQPGKPEEGRGIGQFDLANAWRIDYVLESAAERGLNLMLCIDSYNILRLKDGYPQWDKTPHNLANGGPLQHPTAFWTNAVMDKLYRDKLRYLVARYSYSPALFSWEFWNEVDITTGYRSDLVRAWHERMAKELRRLDPHGHLITTSFAGTSGDARIDRLAELDYVQTHHYNSPDLALTLATVQAQKASYNKPHIVGEIGADSGGPRTKDDPEGLQIHDPIWVSLATGGSGTAQPWWWDNFIQPRDAYGIFAAAVKFTRGIQWTEENFRSVAPRIEWEVASSPRERTDLVLENGPASWSTGALNRPRRVQVTTNGARGELPIASIQHGVRNHADKHNPVTFETDLPIATKLSVEVTDVSGHGGAALKVTLDGKPVLARKFTDRDGQTNTATLKQYAGSYGIDVPAGKHLVVVENTGADWFMASYRFGKIIESSGPPIVAWAIAGENTAIVWARVKDRTWRNVCDRKLRIEPAPASVITLPELSPGNWRVEWWDTWKGEVTRTTQLTVAEDAPARFALPEIARDVAIKLVKQ